MLKIANFIHIFDLIFGSSKEIRKNLEFSPRPFVRTSACDSPSWKPFITFSEILYELKDKKLGKCSMRFLIIFTILAINCSNLAFPKILNNREFFVLGL